MAYIKKSDFSILSGSNIDGFLDDCFECDDMIAPVIQELNRKGYTTKYCCGGHPYIEHSEAVVSVCANPEQIIVGTESIEKLEKVIFRVVYNDRCSAEIYIMFEEGKVPKKIPSYAYKEGNKIIVDFDYDGGDDYLFIRTLLHYNSRLYNWAKGLVRAS